MARVPQKTQHWNSGEKAQDERPGEIALQSKTFERGNAVGGKHPNREHHRQAQAGIYTGSNRGVLENAQLAIAGKVSPDGHESLAPKNCLGTTRSYEEGCVRSAATGAQGALSLPEERRVGKECRS